jgi:hypothetical protein
MGMSIAKAATIRELTDLDQANHMMNFLGKPWMWFFSHHKDSIHRVTSSNLQNAVNSGFPVSAWPISQIPSKK